MPFYGCSRLENIIIPSSVKSIGKYAFYGCTRLKTATFIGTEDQWGGITIDSYNNRLTDLDIVFEPKGDLYKDGKVDSADLLIMQNIMLGNTEFNENADINGDGVFDAADLVFLQLAILGF